MTQFVTSSFAVFEAAIRVKSRYLVRGSKSEKKRKWGNQRNFT